MTQSIVPTSSACAQSSAATLPDCANPHPVTRRSALRGAAATVLMGAIAGPALADVTQTGDDAALLALGRALAASWAAEADVFATIPRPMTDEGEAVYQAACD